MDRDNLEQPTFQLGDFGIEDSKAMSADEVENWLGSDPEAVSKIEEEGEKPKTPAKTAQPPKTKKPDASKKKEDEEQEEEEQELTEEEILKQSLGDEEEEEIKQVKEKNEKPDEKEEGDDNEDEEGDEPEYNTFMSLTKELIDLGVFPPDEGDTQPTDTPEKFLDRFKKAVQDGGINWIENFLTNFGEDRRKLFDAVFFNGVEPQSYLSQYVKVESLANLDLSIESNQEKVLRHYYSSLPGWDKDRIDNKIEKLKTYAGLDEEATEKYEILLAQEQESLTQQEEESKQRIANKAAQEQEYLTNVNRILTDKLKAKDFDGIPVDQAFAQQTAAYITQNKYKLSNGDLITEFDKELLDLSKPANHEKKVKLAMLLQLLKTDPTLSKIKKIAVSTETNEMFSTLRREKKNPIKKGNEKVTSWFQ